MTCVFPVFPASQTTSPGSTWTCQWLEWVQIVQRRDIKNFLALHWSKGLALVIPSGNPFKPRAVQDHLPEESQKNKGEGWVWNQTPQESKSRTSCSSCLTAPGSSKMQNAVCRKDYIYICIYIYMYIYNYDYVLFI